MYNILFIEKKWARIFVKIIAVVLAFCLGLMSLHTQAISYAIEKIDVPIEDDRSSLDQNQDDNQASQQKDLLDDGSDTLRDSIINNALNNDSLFKHTASSKSKVSNTEDLYLDQKKSFPVVKNFGLKKSLIEQPAMLRFSLNASGQEKSDLKAQDGDEKVTTSQEGDKEASVEQPQELKGNGSKDNPYLVSNAIQWVTVTNSGSNNYIRLINNIDLSNETIMHVNDFSGVLDGCGYTITKTNEYSDQGWANNSPSDCAGLFNNLLNGAIIKNLNINMPVFSNNNKAGLIAARVNNDSKVIIQDVTLNGKVEVNLNTSTFFDCSAGGAVGLIDERADVSFIRVKNNAAITAKGLSVRYAGGLVGYSEDASVSFSDCVNNESAEISSVGAMFVALKASVEAIKLIANFLCVREVLNFLKLQKPVSTRVSSSPKNKVDNLSPEEQVNGDDLNALSNDIAEDASDNSFNNLDEGSDLANPSLPGNNTTSNGPLVYESLAVANQKVFLNNLNLLKAANNYINGSISGLLNKIKGFFAYCIVSKVFKAQKIRVISQFYDIAFKGAGSGTFKDNASKFLLNSWATLDTADRNWFLIDHSFGTATSNFFKNIVANTLTVISYTGISVAATLAQISNNLYSAQGGDSALHFNAYAGGLLGYYDANSPNCNLNIKNSSNSANVTGGHNAGGLVGYSEYGTLNIENCFNEGVVSVTDKQFWPASGGILGSYKDGTSNSKLT